MTGRNKIETLGSVRNPRYKQLFGFAAKLLRFTVVLPSSLARECHMFQHTPGHVIAAPNPLYPSLDYENYLLKMAAGWKGFLKQVAWSVPVAIAFTDCVACVIRVDGQSMQPTLNPDTDSRDWVLIEKVTYKLLHRYTRGEVVVFW